MDESNEKPKLIKSTDLYKTKYSNLSITKYCQNFHVLSKGNKLSEKNSFLKLNRTPTLQRYNNTGMIIKTLINPSDFRLSLNQILTKSFVDSPKDRINSNFNRKIMCTKRENFLSSALNAEKIKLACFSYCRKIGLRKPLIRNSKKIKLPGASEKLTGWDAY